MIYAGHPDQKFGPFTYSHNGEDLMVLNLFRNAGIGKPSFLDLGCHHPIHGSNTYLLYCHGSRGVCVDANFQFETLHAAERPEDHFVFGAVGVNRGVIPFYMLDHFSGRNTCSLEEFRRVYPEREPLVESVTCYRLDDIVTDYCGGNWPDFLSCDLEGIDADVIGSVSFSSEEGPKVVCIEANTHSDIKRVSDELLERNYHPFVRLGVNCIYIASRVYHRFTWGFQP